MTTPDAPKNDGSEQPVDHERAPQYGQPTPSSGGFAAPGGVPGPQYGQPAQPQYGQYAPPAGSQNGQPAQPQYGQYAPPSGSQNGQPAQPQYGQPAQPQYGQPAAPRYGNGTPPRFNGYQASNKPGIIPLRPLSMGDIFEGAFAAVRRAPKVLIGLVAAVVAVATLTAGIVGYLIAPLINRSQWAMDITSQLDDTLMQGGIFDMSTEGSMGELSLGLLLALASSLAATIATGLVVVAIGQLVINRPTDAASVWEKVRPRILALIGVSLLPMLALYVVFTVLMALAVFAINLNEALGVILLVVLFIALIVVSLLFVVRFMFAPSALVLEERSVMGALKRSWQLSKGSFWRIFGIYLLTSLALNVVVSLVSGVLGAIVGIAVGMDAATSFPALMGTVIVQIISGTLLASFLSAVMTLLYIDVRIRREALDIELANAAAKNI
ncbi:glycerophosphoryl diester phosphodiesterase membrane domain-containing protein [Timonella senegalensis]|uniref:glycerophosphoryl diester phosphodiesterase membrane domain-containing protein n=1 Tax=Timonella senegalensis TaxID=1465825 RepID=UPI0002D8B787|nr:glycerophosphoryl diester phosphodiesterase membrane domain-containing protein [Timonella senegalensis]